MKAILVVVILAGLVALSAAAPLAFVGGQFVQADGHHSPDFAAFKVDTNQWSTATRKTRLNGVINSMSAAGNGVFAAGEFTTVHESSASNGVAFWDGVKWCPVRQNLGGNGKGRAVVCDTGTSCWVAGDFTDFNNYLEGTSSGSINNFAHYTFDAARDEWVIDSAQFAWNNASGHPLPADIVIDSLSVRGSSPNFFFYAQQGSIIWRGSAADGGWYQLANVNSIPGTILDYSLDPAGSALYVVTDVVGNRSAAVIRNARLNTGCGNNCPNPTVTTDWEAFIDVNAFNSSLFTALKRVVATSGDTRYLIGIYDADDGATPAEFDPHYRVFKQTGTAVPTLVGDPFVKDGSAVLDDISVTENGDPLVFGSFTGANLFYPSTPVTTDHTGLLGDIRPLDHINGLGVFNSSLSRWVQWGAGGLDTAPAATARMAYNSVTKEWFVAYDFVRVYDLRTEALMWYDDDQALDRHFFPVLTRALLKRRTLDQGEVHEVICETSDCTSVFFGGDFAFHGPDTYGAIGRAVVQRSGEPVVSAVGGGLWVTSENFFLNDKTFQLDNGVVTALTRLDNFLYAGGKFSRTASTSGYVCLSNVARLDISANLAGTWEDLAGGCDDFVYDLQEWFGRLYAVGAFTKCGDVAVNYVSAYTLQDETPAWQSLNNGLDAVAYSLEPFQGRLIAGGDFSFAGGIPVSGVASWDGFKWRALLPACQGDCQPGNLPFYFNVLQSPKKVHDLRRDSTGQYLFATAAYEVETSKRAPLPPTTVRYLSRWQYTDGDLGEWLAKGKLNVDASLVPFSDVVANFVDDKILLGGQPDDTTFANVNNFLGVWDQDAENSNVSPSAVNDKVHVIRGPDGGDPGAASSLSSFLLSSLFALFDN